MQNCFKKYIFIFAVPILLVLLCLPIDSLVCNLATKARYFSNFLRSAWEIFLFIKLLSGSNPDIEIWLRLTFLSILKYNPKVKKIYFYITDW